MSIIIKSCLLLFLSITFVIAASDDTTVTVGWVSDPAGRGTFSLIFSCLLTLALCVWSAMHLNIPPHDDTRAKSWSRNVKWGMIGIFAPELVVFAAWRQYNSAKSLQTEVNNQLDAMELQSLSGNKPESLPEVNTIRGILSYNVC
jgi:cytosine/uracil/thiamine/allantoin permease